MFRSINGGDPRQYGLDFGLWTRSLVADLIERKFGIRLGVTAVGEHARQVGTDAAKAAAARPIARSGSDRRRGSAQTVSPLPLPDRQKPQVV